MVVAVAVAVAVATGKATDASGATYAYDILPPGRVVIPCSVFCFRPETKKRRKDLLFPCLLFISSHGGRSCMICKRVHVIGNHTGIFVVGIGVLQFS